MSCWTLESLRDEDAVKCRLTQAGLTPQAAKEKAILFVQAAAELASVMRNASTPSFAWYVPGRIEVLGKHTDYAGGRSLTAAVERGICAVGVEREERLVQITDVRHAQNVEIRLSPDIVPAAGHWSNYPMTVVRRLIRNFSGGGPLRPAALAFASDLPMASGMSSSSALVIAIFELLAEVNQLRERLAYQRNICSPLDLADYAATIENGQSFRELTGDRGVGTFGGSEDHVAILGARSGSLGQYSYCPVRQERVVTLSNELVFAVASSGVVAEKTGAAMERYNRASQLASAVAEIWRSGTGRDDAHMAAAIRSAPDAADRLRELLHRSRHPLFQPEELLQRFEHFLAESEQLIPAVPPVLTANTLDRFGEMADRSQFLAESLLGNQLPETSFLARSARECGALAASAFGAGFGGSVWALVERNQVDPFLEAWSRRYCHAYPMYSKQSTFFASGPGPAAFAL